MAWEAVTAVAAVNWVEVAVVVAEAGVTAVATAVVATVVSEVEWRVGEPEAARDRIACHSRRSLFQAHSGPRMSRSRHHRKRRRS